MVSGVEHVVLLDEEGCPVGTAPKSAVHHARTPLHLAFSIFLFDGQGQALFQQRALHKLTWPGVWSNACCGHPGPDEDLATAARRRLAHELGITTDIPLTLALPDFRYQAAWNGVWENEICPVLVGHYEGPVFPHAAEVAATRWISWESFAASCRPESMSTHSEFDQFSPWSRWEAAQLMMKHPPLCGGERLSPASAHHVF